MSKVTVYAIDDHNVLRQAVTEMLAAEPDIEVLGHAGDAEVGLAEAEELKPSVVVVDLKMPGLGGLAAIAQISKRLPKTSVLVFTMYDNPAYVWEATKAGASGYVLKSASKDELLAAVRAVHAGRGFLQSEITKPLLERLAKEAHERGLKAALTGREVQILECLTDGLSNKAIAALLGIAEDTVKAHLRSLYEKLGARDRAHAVALALRQRLVE